MAQRSCPWGQPIRTGMRRRLLASLVAVVATTAPVWNGTATAHDHANSWLGHDFDLNRIVQIDTLIGSKRQSFISPLTSVSAANLSAGRVTTAGTSLSADGLAAKEAAARRVEEFCRLHELVAGRAFPDPWVLAGNAEGLALQSKLPRRVSSDSVARSASVSREISRSLGDLSCEEPVDVIRVRDDSRDSEIAAQPPQFAAIGGVGGTPMVVTLDEPYLAYDLSPEDRIAMRMYPIPGPEADYFGGRRTGVDRRWLDLGPRVTWQATHEPAEVVATGSSRGLAQVADAGTGEVEAGVRAESVAVAAAELDAEAVDRWLELAKWGRQTAPAASSELGRRLVAGLANGFRELDSTVGSLVTKLAAAWPPPQPQVEVAEDLRLAEATLLEPRPAGDDLASTDGGAAVDGDSMAVVTEPVNELAGDPSEELAYRTALEVVTAQAGQESERSAAENVEAIGPKFAELAASGLPTDLIELADRIAKSADGSIEAEVSAIAMAAEDRIDPITRAEAVATACDQTAAALERFAVVLRRAGDQLVRQAKAGDSSAAGTLIR